MLDTDASAEAIGAELSQIQEGHSPIIGNCEEALHSISEAALGYVSK